MDFIWHQVNDTLNLSFKHTGGRDSSGLFDDHGHWDSLVKQTKLSLGGLVVGGVQVDSSVKDGTVNVGNHGSNISGSVCLLTALKFFNSILDGLIPVDRVTLISRVNSLATIFWEGHLDTSVDEFSNGTVQAESFNCSTLEGEDHLNGRRVGDISSAQARASVSQQILDGSVGSRSAFVNREDGSDTDVAVNVGRPVQRIKGDTEFSGTSRGDNNWLLVFFRHQNAADTRVNQGVNHHVITQDIQLLLVVTSGVDFSSQTV
mmetsp:Transcript_16355/g.39940  ORF Transcript_16355/g.39940 Transcript_16355/m.39940 type:complete len:261 (-) Transcript_16355:302-1084(-)